MVGNCARFVNFVACKPTSIAGISSSLHARGVGSVFLCANLGNGNSKPIELRQSLYVPGIRHNLISIYRLGKQGLDVRFGKEAVISLGNEIQGRGVATPSGLYRFDGSHIPSVRASAFLAMAARPSLTTWHARFSHIHHIAIQKLSKSDQVSGLEILDDKSVSSDCVVCQGSKSKRLPFSPSETRATRVLGRVHSDILEPSVLSRCRKRYILTLLDNYSRKEWMIPIARKSDAYKVFVIWLNRVVVETGQQLDKFRSDGGGEYWNHRFWNLAKVRGFKHEHTQTHTPQQNARAEWINLGATEGMIANLEQSGLPRTFWPDALNFLWYKKPADISFLRPFGCRAVMTILKVYRKKLDPKGRQVIFIGYEPGVKAYRLWDPVLKKVHISRDVRFFEDQFPLSRTTLRSRSLW